MKPADIILGVYRGDEAFIETFKGIVRSKSSAMDIPDGLKDDIVQILTENILFDRRGILSKAKEEPDNISKTYFYTWIKWEIFDALKEINEDFSYISIDENIYQGEDGDDSDEGLKLSDTIYYEKGDIEDQILAEELCEHLKKFIGSLPEKEKIVLCISLKYIDPENTELQISRSNFDVIVHRVKKKLNRFFYEEGLSQEISSIMKIIDNGLLKSCSLNEVCQGFSPLYGMVK